MTERTCVTCGSVFEQTPAGRADRCSDCRRAAKLERERERYKASRPEPTPTLRTCELCGSDFTQSAGAPARWCRPCRPEAARMAAKRWNQENPDRVKAGKARDKDYVRAYRARRPRCIEPECRHPGVYTDGLCVKHHSRLVRTGTTADPAPKPYKESIIDARGYRMVRVGPGKYVGEHRLVAEAALRRPLEPYENVHHKNGLRLDNRLDNLEVWVTPQPSGQRPEDLVEWVVEHYSELVRAALSGEPMTLF